VNDIIGVFLRRSAATPEGASAPSSPRCRDCGDVPGDGIDCPACQVIRAARHRRDREEQNRYDKAKLTRSLDDTPEGNWRRRRSIPGCGPAAGGNDGKPCAGSIETDAPVRQAGEGGVNPAPALQISGERTGDKPDTKGIDMVRRLPVGKLPPLLAETPPRSEGNRRCENPRSNPKCCGTTTKRLCRSCGILESRIRRGLRDGDAVPAAAVAAATAAAGLSPPALGAPPASAAPSPAPGVTSRICRQMALDALREAELRAAPDSPCLAALKAALRWLRAESALHELEL